jgi:hypothetical protein
MERGKEKERKTLRGSERESYLRLIGLVFRDRLLCFGGVKVINVNLFKNILK